MRWPAVITAVLDLLEADPQLSAALGGAHVYEAVTGRESRIPSLEYTVVADTEAENTEDVVVQLDVIAHGMTAAIAIETRVRALLALQLPVTIGGIEMWSMFEGGRNVPFPAQGGAVQRALDFRFTPARSTAA